MEIKTAVWGLLIPFIGTAAGAASVFFLKKDLRIAVQRALTGFAAGVMVAGAAGVSAGFHRILAGNSLPSSSGSCNPAPAQKH